MTARAALPAAVWLVSRALVLLAVALYFQGDIATYYRQGHAWLAGQIPYLEAPVEYPPAALLVFTGLCAVTGSYLPFRIGFVGLCLALDALVFWLLIRRGLPAALVYTVAGALLFPVLLVRFDLLPAAALLGALLLLDCHGDPRRVPIPPRALATAGEARLHPRDRPDAVTPGRTAAAGALYGLGVALKLFPLLLLPWLLLQAWRRKVRPVVLAAGLGAAALVVLASFVPPLLAGAGRTVLSFLRYQGERGLQIESSYAAGLLLLEQIVPLELAHNPSHAAHDLVGPLTAPLALAARLLQPAAVLLVTVLAWRGRLGCARAAAAILGTALVTANVFSPQFLLWLLPLAALAAGRVLARESLLLVAVAGLTSVIFPALYPALTALDAGAILVLGARNLLLALLVLELLLAQGGRRQSATPAGASTR